MYSEVSKEKLRESFVNDIADNRAFFFLYQLYIISYFPETQKS